MQVRALKKAGNVEAASALAISLWQKGNASQRKWAAFHAPNLLMNMGRTKDALRLYDQAVAEDFVVGDFRVHNARSSLALSDPNLAARLYLRDRNAYLAAFRSAETGARAWTPIAGADGVVELRGATALPAASAAFDLYIAGASTPRRVQAAVAQHYGGVTHWRATIDDLPRGQQMTIRLTAEVMVSAPVLFVLPEIPQDKILTRAGDLLGIGGATLAGTAIQRSAAARYRFEYGEGPVLDCATPWRQFPPPATASAYKPLYRHTGEWTPTCVNARWIHRDATSPEPEDPGFALGAPFSKDRNQLTGIDAHEMVVGFSWARTDGGISWGLGGGQLDLRDAEISFIVAGKSLDQKGHALHYWASHAAMDALGPFTSQWAFTGAPFPDEVLADGAVRRVTFRLLSDPGAWTYTGNNPHEQGPRANRYRRAPLDATLSDANVGSVLIFAFGNARRPPTGSVVLYATEVRHRDYSLLSPAAQGRLMAFPAGGLSDPLALTAGKRGYDEHLWTSGPSPVFPLEFTWKLAEAVNLKHFQICQHPYWPARDIEITATDNEGVQRTLWAGELGEGRPDHNQPAHVLVPLSGVTATAVTVRILSGYHAERCGLDSVAFYGDGAVFMPDGTPGTFSEEVSGLTPGAMLNYRMVVEDGGDTQAGAIAFLALPSTAAPILESAQPLKRPRDPACYAVRANAMGLDTKLWGELNTGGEVFSGPRVDLGSQPTGRHIYYIPEGLPDRPGAFRLRARNAAGETFLPAAWPLC